MFKLETSPGTTLPPRRRPRSRPPHTPHGPPMISHSRVYYYKGIVVYGETYTSYVARARLDFVRIAPAWNDVIIKQENRVRDAHNKAPRDECLRHINAILHRVFATKQKF